MSAVFTHLLAFMVGGACGMLALALVVAGGRHDD